MIPRILKTTLVLIIIGAIFYSVYAVFGGKWGIIYNEYFSCKKPILYSIGSFDERFGISIEDFKEYLREAESMWEKSVDKNLFIFEPDDTKGDDLKVNLIYDYRQEATAKLKALGITVSDTKRSYDTLKSKYQTMQRDYLKLNGEYESKSKSFETKQKEYNKEVEDWNSKGGAPADVYKELNARALALKDELSALNDIEGDLNKKVDDINALVTVINRLAKTLNLNATELNTIGQKTRGEEFTQGEYKSSAEGREINIYEFSTEAKLVRVLTHEFGHALGLGHVDDPQAVMYRLNESKNEKLTKDETDALKLLCKIK